MPVPKNHFSRYLLPKNLTLAPYPVRLLLQPPWEEFMRNNGYLELSKKLNLQVFSAIEEAKSLWQKFSPNQSVFDLWEIRESFYEGYKFTPYFPTIIKQQGKRKEILGILPLWFNSDPTFGKTNSDYQKYVWFGSNWPEDNIFFVKEKDIIPLLLTIAPTPLQLECIRPLPQYKFLEEFSGFRVEEDKKYFLDLTKISTIDDFFSRLKKKKRYNLRRDRKNISKVHPQIVIDNYDHLEEMFNLSIRRFREKYPDNPDEFSAFEDERRRNVFRQLINNQGKYQVRLISTLIKGKLEAVEFGLIYNKTYYAFNSGVDISNYSGLGVFSNLLIIEDAIKLGCQKMDFLESDNNWKDSWCLDYYYQYQFTK